MGCTMERQKELQKIMLEVRTFFMHECVDIEMQRIFLIYYKMNRFQTQNVEGSVGFHRLNLTVTVFLT